MAFSVPTVSKQGITITSVVIPKPTGLTVGDLMVAQLSVWGWATGVVNTLSGWTLVAGRSVTGGFVSVQYKIADSGDVSASDFTFTTDTGRIAGSIMRVTGNTPTGSFDTYASDFNTVASGSQINLSAAITPEYNGSLVVMTLWAGDGNAGVGSMSSYTSTPSMTWTETYSYGEDAGTQDGIGAGAYAIQSTAEEITAFGATTSSDKDDHAGIIAVFTPAINATASNALFQTTPITFSTLTGSTQDTTNANFSVVPVILPQSASSTNPTQWTAESKPNTTWSSET